MSYLKVTRLSPSSLYWLACSASIFLLSVLGRNMQVWLYSHISRAWITPGVLLLSFLLLLQLYRKRYHFSIHPGSLFAACFLMVFGALAVYFDYLMPIEMTHFLVFSLLGWLSVGAFGIVWGSLAMLGVAIGDEILQFFLPTRVGDLHDVVINGLSGFFGIWLGRNK